MFWLMLIGVLLLAASCDAQNTTEVDTASGESTVINMIVKVCSLDDRLNATEAFFFAYNVTGEEYKRQCAEHKQDWECIANVTGAMFNNSDLQDESIEVQIFTGMGVFCNDPRVKPECLAKYSQSSSEILTCQITRLENINAATKEGKLRTCLQATVNYNCIRDVLEKCDVEMFNAISEYLELEKPADCLGAIVG